MSRPRYKPTAYYLLLGASTILILTGLVMVLNASSVKAYSDYGDSYYYLKRQLIWLVLGLFGMFFCSRADYRKLVKYSPVLIVLTAVALLLTHLPGIGQTAKGASRAIALGPFSFQPSEPAKLALILYIASVLSVKRRELGHLTSLAPAGFVVIIIAGLVLFQPDLGTTIIIALSVLTMLFLGGARIRDVVGLATASFLGGLAFAMSASYRRNRILAFIDPSSDPRGIGYQIRQSLIALGSGGPAGVGLGMSRQKFFFLPESHTDFIYAIIGEELGLPGTLLVVVAFGIMAYAGINIAFKTKDYLGKILGAGITASIVGQAFVNLGAVTGILPVTGVPLPLVSSGGSSLIVTMSMIGILMNIASRERRVCSNEAYEGDSKRRRDGRPHLSRARAVKSAGIR